MEFEFNLKVSFYSLILTLNINVWLQALDSQYSYQHIKSDEQQKQKFCVFIFIIQPMVIKSGFPPVSSLKNIVTAETNTMTTWLLLLIDIKH